MKRRLAFAGLTLVCAGCVIPREHTQSSRGQEYAVLVPDYQLMIAQYEQSWPYNQDARPIFLTFTVSSVEH